MSVVVRVQCMVCVRKREGREKEGGRERGRKIETERGDEEGDRRRERINNKSQAK